MKYCYRNDVIHLSRPNTFTPRLPSSCKASLFPFAPNWLVLVFRNNSMITSVNLVRKKSWATAPQVFLSIVPPFMVTGLDRPALKYYKCFKIFISIWSSFTQASIPTALLAFISWINFFLQLKTPRWSK